MPTIKIQQLRTRAKQGQPESQFLSSQIEGAQSSLPHLLKREAEILDPDTPKDVNEVITYVGAMNDALSDWERFLHKGGVHGTATDSC